jgi:glycosyltransferase involved in cell wall biosynthesis
MNNQILTIITVCYNAAGTIEETIRSVLDQTWKNIEYIIIDGASTDNTLNIVAKYRERINVVVSEKDAGLYDAMNKGLRLATGDYVLFLNADDTLYATDTLEKAFARCPDADVIYGEAMFVNEAGKALGLRSVQTPHKVPRHLTWKSLRYGMVVSHQAFIIRRALAEPYNLEYRVCADIDWMIRCLKKCRSACYVDGVISNFRVGGVSKQQQKSGWKERYRILSRHYGRMANFFNHVYIGGRYIFSRKY